MWKPIPEFPDYEASEDGEIRHATTLRVRKPNARNCNGKGYLMVAMPVNGKWTVRPVHRLVASAFLGPCPTRMEVNHKNIDKLDNRASNLEYVTHQQNSAHYFLNRTKPDPRARMTPEQIKEIKEALANGSVQRTLATRYGVTQAVISKIARGVAYRWLTN